MKPEHAKRRIQQRIETMNKLRGRPLTNVEKLANIRRAFDEEDAMDRDHAKRVLEHQRFRLAEQLDDHAAYLESYVGFVGSNLEIARVMREAAAELLRTKT